MCPSIYIQAARSCNSATCHVGSACDYLHDTSFDSLTHSQDGPRKTDVTRCDCRKALIGKTVLECRVDESWGARGAEKEG